MARLKQLADFLTSAFDVEGLRRFVSSLRDDPLVKAVDWRGSVAEVAFRARASIT